MGKITEALKKVADERVARIQKKPEIQYVVRKLENTNINEHIVSFHDPASPVGEQYKILRTNIQTLKSTKGNKTFVLTSSIHGEGKTVTAINLAMALAHDLNNKSVLLIDADMRKGKVAEYLGLKRSPGLSDVLKGNAQADSIFVSPNIDDLIVCFRYVHGIGYVGRNIPDITKRSGLCTIAKNCKRLPLHELIHKNAHYVTISVSDILIFTVHVMWSKNNIIQPKHLMCYA